MQSITEISHLSREEKLRVMEDIWDDLSKEEIEVGSPSLHHTALRKTKLRVESGQETIGNQQKKIFESDSNESQTTFYCDGRFI